MNKRRSFKVTVEVTMPVSVMEKRLTDAEEDHPELFAVASGAVLDKLNVNGMLSAAFDRVGALTEDDSTGCWLAPGESFALEDGQSGGVLKVHTEEVGNESVSD